MKKTVQLWIVALVVALCSTSLSAKTPKYIFFCIGDGMSFSHVLATQLYYEHGNYKAGNESIAFLDFPVHSAVRTHANNSLITCSAARQTVARQRICHRARNQRTNRRRYSGSLLCFANA